MDIAGPSVGTCGNLAMDRALTSTDWRTMPGGIDTPQTLTSRTSESVTLQTGTT